MTQQTGRARFHDGPYDVLRAPPPPLAGGEVLVGVYPPGVYRMQTGPDGVHLYRRDPEAPTVDADPSAQLRAINAANRRFYRQP